MKNPYNFFAMSEINKNLLKEEVDFNFFKKKEKQHILKKISNFSMWPQLIVLMTGLSVAYVMISYVISIYNESLKHAPVPMMVDDFVPVSFQNGQAQPIYIAKDTQLNCRLDYVDDKKLYGCHLSLPTVSGAPEKEVAMQFELHEDSTHGTRTLVLIGMQD